MTEITKSQLAFTVSWPKHKMTGVEIVLIVSPQFLKTAASHVQ